MSENPQLRKSETSNAKVTRKSATPKREADRGEVGGPKGPEPTRYGDWERNGRCIDF
jgi:hypothetical protein